MPMSRLRGGTSSTGRPATRIVPALGVSKPASIIRQVVLPEPDGPSRVRNSPSWTVRCKSLTMGVTPS